MAVTLKPITKDSWRACVQLRLAPDQEPFVASNAYSLAQSKYEPNCVPLGIYDGETMVGFAMYARDAEEDTYWIYRLMIDCDQQAKGYGREALRQVIRLLERMPDATPISLSYLPDNAVAERLYLSEGFAPTGEESHGERIARRTIGREQPKLEMFGLVESIEHEHSNRASPQN